LRLIRFKNLFSGDNKNKSARVFLALVLLFSCVLVFLGWSIGKSISALPEEKPAVKLQAEYVEPNSTLNSEQAEPNTIEALEMSFSQPRLVHIACELIYRGKFDAAGELLKQKIAENPNEPETAPPLQDEFSTYISQLLELTDKYQTLEKQRQSNRQTAYQQQLAELEKLQAEMGASDANDITKVLSITAETSDFTNNAQREEILLNITDANDANDITKVLSAIASASELATDTQREELLSRPFVKQVFQNIIDKAAGLELQGKWLDAYTTCYAWLQAIDPNNEAYSDYTDQLLDKASIVVSLQDSPCETREERFQGVKKEMFVRAIGALDMHYVSTIDYNQMAAAAIKRCQIFADVMETYLKSGQQLPADLSGGENSFMLPDANELAIFSTALAQMLSEVESSQSSITGFLRFNENSKQDLTLSTGFTKDKFIEVFEWILALNAVTVQFPRQVLIAQFAEAALSSLDPYTVMVWPRQVQEFEKMMTKEFTGIGIEITKQKGLLTVSSLLPDTPAYRAGLDAGDVITAVDGLDTKDMSLMCAVHKITGPKGTKVTLTTKRAGEEKSRDVTITRAKINVQSIRGWQRTKNGEWLYMIDQQNEIGYVRVTDCIATTASELEKVLTDLEAEGLKALILDLRFNPGGFLDSAVDVADKFLKEGLIVSTQPGFGRTLAYKAAHKKGTHPDYPMVVLINSNSASGAEIIAGALADPEHNRAILVGERTHGKGLVQGIIQFSNSGAQLKYTMSYYHLPSGQMVKSRDAAEKAGTKDWGIGPNIEIELTNDELRKMISVQRDNDVLVQADRGGGRQSPQRHTLEETLDTDPQLEVAVLAIKTKLIQGKINNIEYKIQDSDS
jgi:carboxyl-terminal processing protease